MTEETEFDPDVLRILGREGYERYLGSLEAAHNLVRGHMRDSMLPSESIAIFALSLGMVLECAGFLEVEAAPVNIAIKMLIRLGRRHAKAAAEPVDHVKH